LIDEAIDAGLEMLPLLLSDGGQKAMHRLHTRNVPPGGPPPAS
jgi:hypothetical protein